MKCIQFVNNNLAKVPHYVIHGDSKVNDICTGL